MILTVFFSFQISAFALSVTLGKLLHLSDLFLIYKMKVILPLIGLLKALNEIIHVRHSAIPDI